MDETDRKLIALLRADSRAPTASLARVLKVSRGTVQNRIDRLMAGGSIRDVHSQVAQWRNRARVIHLSALSVSRRQQTLSDAETLNLERTLSDLVNQAYALTPAEIDLLWKTAPPRMSIPPPTTTL